jgi:hypothetical protein
MKNKRKNKTPEDAVILFGRKILIVDDSDVFEINEKFNKNKNNKDEIR